MPAPGSAATADAGAVDAAVATHDLGCAGTRLRPVPDDPAARGPWPVGARTVALDGIAIEVWYPAEPGSDAGKTTISYDLREHLPPVQAARVGDDVNTPQACACVRDLPIDAAHGPYPVVVFFHGAGSFRTQSAALATHWASRGFVVVAPDLPAVNLRTALGDPVPGNPWQHGPAVVAAVHDGAAPFADLAGAVRSDLMALVGHSLGGGIARAARDQPGVVAAITMASGGIGRTSAAVHTTIIGGTADRVVPFGRQESAFADEPPPARLIAIEGAGHLAFSDLCLIGRDRGGMLEVAVAAGVEVPARIRALATDGCGPDNLDPERGLTILRAATAAALEERLHCSASATDALGSLGERYREVSRVQDRAVR